MTFSTTKNPSQHLPDGLADTIKEVVSRALREDLGTDELSPTNLCRCDITTAATVPPEKTATAQLIVKTAGVLAGLPVCTAVFETLDPSIKVETLVREGDFVNDVPKIVARYSGSAQAILVAERTALNLIQRLSGIATVTHKFATKAKPFGIKILDTRKTTPGLRALEKYAVAVGGGANHRFGLYDAVLIKDNHISIAGGITAAVSAVRQQSPEKRIEVEVTNDAELDEALSCAVPHIMLDNMTPDQIRAAVKRIAKRAFIEVSGGINSTNLDSYLIEGVDAISVGAITHSVTSLDISLEVED